MNKKYVGIFLETFNLFKEYRSFRGHRNKIVDNRNDKNKLLEKVNYFETYD